MRKGTRYFLLLSALVLSATGCGQIAESEILTLEKVEKYMRQYGASPDEEKVEYCFESDNHSTYAYDSLQEAERLWYRDINEMLSARSEDGVSLSKEGFDKGLSESDIDKIYQCVLIDHPEYFYVEGYEYTIYSSWEEIAGIEIKGTYDLPLEECLERKEQIDAKAGEILQKAPTEGTDYEKIKYVYETVIYNTEYCMDAADNQNIYSVFVGQASVCQGYAKATQYLLNSLGVECTMVFGEVGDGEGHAWNLVSAEDEYYFVDTTWGDASYLADEQEVTEPNWPDINYDYLCITTEQLVNTHTVKHELELPVCEAVRSNYYRMEGCYMESYNEEQISREFQEAFTEEKGYVTLKCSDAGIYEVLFRELIENQKVFEYLEDSYETIAYIENEPQLSLTFWMTN